MYYLQPDFLSSGWSDSSLDLNSDWLLLRLRGHVAGGIMLQAASDNRNEVHCRPASCSSLLSTATRIG